MHHKRKTDRPGFARMLFLLVLLSAALTATLVVMFTGDPGARETWIALGLGFVMITSLTYQTATTAGAESSRRVMSELNAVERERRKVANTATWRRNGKVVTTVRYDPDTARYYVKGELVGERFITETWWREPSRLWFALDDLEHVGARPDSDEGTRTVRARIDLPTAVDPISRERTQTLFNDWTQR